MNANVNTTIAPSSKGNKAELNPAQKLGKAIEAAAAADTTARFARPELARMAKEVFDAPVTVAHAAVVLGVDISAKGLDKEDVKSRTWVMRCRVNLQRALQDANLIVKDPTKGRKVQDSGEDNDGQSPKGKRKARNEESAFQAVMRNLGLLSNDELDKVSDKLIQLTYAAAAGVDA